MQPLRRHRPSRPPTRRRSNLDARIALASAGLVGLTSFVDWLEHGYFQPASLWVRGAAIAASLLIAYGFTRASARGKHALHVLLSLVNTGGFLTLVVLSGGANSRHFAFLLAQPANAALLSRGQRSATLASGALSLAAAVALPLLAGRPAREAAQWGVMHAALAGMCLAGASVFGRLRRAVLRERAGRLRLRARLARSEELRAQAERLALLGQLTAGVAHEANNPLAYAKANLYVLEQTLARGGQLSAEVAESVSDARFGIERTATLLRELRLFSRERPPALVPCALPLLVQESLRLASARLQQVPAAVETDLPASLPPVLGDPARLGQVLLNLLVNAADALEAQPEGFAPGGPAPALTAVPAGLSPSLSAGGEGRPGARIRVRAEVAGDRVSLWVEDDGPGIRPEHLHRLFTPFFTTKPLGTGTGLGLALSSEYVRQCGGVLRAENRAGGGAAFVVELRTA